MAHRESHKNPVQAWDPAIKQEVLLVLTAMSSPCDNPMASELSGHIGHNGLGFCRKCYSGGSQIVRNSNSGFHNLFEVR
jgi:hypothetical protein